jgi:signal transduction histidine kinase
MKAMATELRDSGISPVGQIPWGTHFFQFYETKEDLLEILVPYFKAGLESNEFCLWVISEPLTQEDARSALEQAVPEFDQYLAAGTIEFIPDEEWYLKGGIFDLRRVIKLWNDKSDQALAKDYAGMRGSGNTSWIQEDYWRDFREYEREVDASIHNRRLIVLCTFPLAGSGAAEILDVANVHQFAVARRLGKWEVVETSELKQSKEEIRRINEELEQRVTERTRELEAANEHLRREVAERKRAENAEREQRSLAEALRDTASALTSTLDFEEVLDRILENVGLVVPHETSLIFLLENDHWRVAGHKGLAERGLKEWIEGLQPTVAERPIYRRILQSAQPLVIPDSHADPDWVILPELAWIRSVMSAPIRAKGRYLGLLNLHSAVPNYFTNAHVAPLQAFADQAAVALENASLLREVHAGRERLQALSEQLLDAQEAERRAVARELHDEIGQVLAAVGANLLAIEPSSRPVNLSERLEESLDLVDDAIKRIRDLSLDLRPSLLDDFGAVPALEWYIDRQAQRSGWSAEFVAEPSEMRLPPGLETTCFRVAQVALTNVARHAQAKKVRVELLRHQTELEMVISDDGVGFDVQAALERARRGATLGLLSMEERVRLARGVLEIKSAPGHGTEIRVRFPLG